MLDGVWFDGLSSEPRAVRLHLAAPGVLALETSDGSSTLWPVSEIRVSPRLGATPRMLRREGYGQIECVDSPEIDVWFVDKTSRIEVFVDWLERRKFAILVAALATGAFMVGLLRFGVPALAKIVAERTPQAVERQASNQAMVLLEK